MNSTLTRPPHVSPDQWERALSDFETYRRLLPRLLEEGHAGRIAIIKNDQLVGIQDTVSEALEEADERLGAEPIATFKINPLDVERFARLDAGSPARKEATCLS